MLQKDKKCKPVDNSKIKRGKILKNEEKTGDFLHLSTGYPQSYQQTSKPSISKVFLSLKNLKKIEKNCQKTLKKNTLYDINIKS